MTKKPVQINRDPFARASLMREVAFTNPSDNQTRSEFQYTKTGHIYSHSTMHSCDWCGQIPKTLYRYWWESDGWTNREWPATRFRGEFCSVSCWRSYNS